MSEHVSGQPLSGGGAQRTTPLLEPVPPGLLLVVPPVLPLELVPPLLELPLPPVPPVLLLDDDPLLPAPVDPLEGALDDPELPPCSRQVPPTQTSGAGHCGPPGGQLTPRKAPGESEAGLTLQAAAEMNTGNNFLRTPPAGKALLARLRLKRPPGRPNRRPRRSPRSQRG